MGIKRDIYRYIDLPTNNKKRSDMGKILIKSHEWRSLIINSILGITKKLV